MRKGREGKQEEAEGRDRKLRKGRGREDEGNITLDQRVGIILNLIQMTATVNECYFINHNVLPQRSGRWHS